MNRVQVGFSIVLLHILVGCGGGDTSILPNSEKNTTTIESNPITISYGNSGEIYFDWNKSSDIEEKLYIDSSVILTKRDKSQYKIKCIPKEQNNSSINYLCDDSHTMNIAKMQTNNILLDDKKVGTIKIVQREERIKL